MRRDRGGVYFATGDVIQLTAGGVALAVERA